METFYSKPKKIFSDVDIGEMFVYGTELYLKIRRTDEDNVFNTYSDMVCTIYKDTIVQPVEAHIHYKL